MKRLKEEKYEYVINPYTGVGLKYGDNLLLNTVIILKILLKLNHLI